VSEYHQDTKAPRISNKQLAVCTRYQALDTTERSQELESRSQEVETDPSLIFSGYWLLTTDFF
jgi:hypothetical protein